MSSQQGSPAPPGRGDPAQDRSGSAEAGSSRGDSSAPAAAAAPAPVPAAAAAAPASAPGQAPAAAGGQPGRSQPESPAAAGQGTLTKWTVDKRSDRALNTFLAPNRPRVSHQDRPRQVRRVAEATAATGAAAVTTKRGRRGSSKNNPKSVSAAELVANNPREGFTVSFGKLYCEPCAKEISTNCDTIKCHIGVSKNQKAGATCLHKVNLAKWQKAKGEAPGRLARLEKWGAERYGMSTGKAVRACRVEVLSAWLTAGLPIARLDDIRQLLVSLGVDMVESSKFREYIGFLQEEERLRCSVVFNNQYYSVVFDGSPVFHQVPLVCALFVVLTQTRGDALHQYQVYLYAIRSHCIAHTEKAMSSPANRFLYPTIVVLEAFGVMVRVVTQDLEVVQNLVRLHLLDGSMNADHIAAEVCDILRDLGLTRTNCMALMYDSCAANLKAIRTVIQIFYPGTAGIQCMSHLFSNTGGKVDTEWADKLIGGIRALTCHSYKNQSLWKAKTGKTFKSVNAVRR